ncbi:MAG: hypothetical protein R3300_22385 [Candidatus Promineifilaceae bacterium]|nr:hypothetical protein [Candidatus Promineifilaceae bacterium]
MGKKSLCKWDKSDIRDDFEKLAKIVGKPKYACRDCARAARKKKYLCEPRRLK